MQSDQLLRQVKSQPLTQAEEIAWVLAYQQHGDTHALNRLMVAHTRFVYKLAHGFAGYHQNFDDLVQQGFLGLMVAIGKFQREKNVRLISYACFWIRAYMQQWVIKNWSLVKVGTTRRERHLFFKLRSTKQKMIAQADEPIDLSTLHRQLASCLEVSTQDIEQMLPRLEQADAALNDAVESEGLLSKNNETHIIKRDQLQHYRHCLNKAISSLKPRSRQVLQQRFFSTKPQTFKQLATTLQVSSERVRQIEQQSLLALRKVLPQNLRYEISVAHRH